MILFNSHAVQPTGRSDANRGDSAPEQRPSGPDASGVTIFGLGDTTMSVQSDQGVTGTASDTPNVWNPDPPVTIDHDSVAVSASVRAEHGGVVSGPGTDTPLAASTPPPPDHPSGETGRIQRDTPRATLDASDVIPIAHTTAGGPVRARTDTPHGPVEARAHRAETQARSSAETSGGAARDGLDGSVRVAQPAAGSERRTIRQDVRPDAGNTPVAPEGREEPVSPFGRVLGKEHLTLPQKIRTTQGTAGGPPEARSETPYGPSGAGAHPTPNATQAAGSVPTPGRSGLETADGAPRAGTEASAELARPADSADKGAVRDGNRPDTRPTSVAPAALDTAMRSNAPDLPIPDARNFRFSPQPPQQAVGQGLGPTEPRPGPFGAPLIRAPKPGSSPTAAGDTATHPARTIVATDSAPQQPSSATGLSVAPSNAQPKTGDEIAPAARDSETSRIEAARVEAARADTSRGESARAVSMQLGDAVRQGTNGSTEVALNPEELGRVRLSLSTQDGTLHVAITAERPETHDLIRRNIALLQADFRAIGYTDVAFDFGPGGHQADGSAWPAQEAVPESGASEPSGMAPQSATDPSANAAASTRLDLRL